MNRLSHVVPEMTSSCAGQTASERVEQVFNVARSALARIAVNLEKPEFRLFPDPARRNDPATGSMDSILSQVEDAVVEKYRRGRRPADESDGDRSE